ncbi:MAG: glycosyl hydrolase family 28-related protein [Ignavibacteriota bacterium]
MAWIGAMSSIEAANYMPPTSGYTVNVRDYGAKGDGVTDDTSAIQTAINQLESRGGGVLTVPAGTLPAEFLFPHPPPLVFS